MTVMPLCTFIRHPIDPQVGTRASFCDEPATSVVVHWSQILGRRAPHYYCADHARLIADQIVEYIAAGYNA